MRKQTKIVAALSATALLALGASAAVFAAGWDNSTGSWQYLDSHGDPVTDTWKKSGDYWFYLGSDGDMVTSEFVDDDDDTYYVNEDGAMVTNQWVASDEDNDTDADYRWYYFDSNGKALKNNDSVITKSDIETINGKKYLFDEDGKMLYGWLNKDTADIQEDDDQAWENSDYYYGGWDDGSAQTGWVELTVKNSDDEDKDYWFYFDGNGKKKTKKQTINGGTYYFDKDDGHMISGWVVATNGTYSEVTSDTNATNNDFIYVNDDGAARKNQWIWTVPSDDWTDDTKTQDAYGKDSDDNEYSWFWALSSGKFYTGTSTKNIKGKTYIFDEYGRMLSDLVAVTTDGKNRRLDPGDYNGDEFAASTADLTTKGNGTKKELGYNKIAKLYYFSDDEAKDGSKKSGYVNVEFDDDTYQMYFKNNGEAYGLNGGEYVSKIKKYVSNGVVLKANGEDSNYAGLVVDGNVNYKTPNSSIKVNGTIKYGTETVGCVLVNASGTVQKSKKGIKDSNGVYYWTDKNGIIAHATEDKLKSCKEDDAGARSIVLDGKTVYYKVSD